MSWEKSDQTERWDTRPLSLFSDQFLIKLTWVLRNSSGSIRNSLNSEQWLALVGIQGVGKIRSCESSHRHKLIQPKLLHICYLHKMLHRNIQFNTTWNLPFDLDPCIMAQKWPKWPKRAQNSPENARMANWAILISSLFFSTGLLEGSKAGGSRVSNMT